MSIAGDVTAILALGVSFTSAFYAKRANDRSREFAIVPVLAIIEGQMVRLRNTGEQNILDVRVNYDGKRSHAPILQPGGYVDLCSAQSFILDSAFGSMNLEPILCEYPAGVPWEMRRSNRPRLERHHDNSSASETRPLATHH